MKRLVKAAIYVLIAAVLLLSAVLFAVHLFISYLE